MLKVDLITGFLGAGKTTFIHKYLHYLKEHGQKVAIVENEFGGADVDTKMLKDEEIPISSLTGVCMCCKGKTMFQGMICSAAAEGYDRLLVEPSGIYDVDEFFSTMMDRTVKSCSEIGSIITIMDAKTDDQLSDEAKYISFSQLLASGKVLMSKSQFASEEEIQHTVSFLNQLMKDHGSSRTFTEEDMMIKDWNDLTDDDYAALQTAGYRILDHDREILEHEAVFQAYSYANYCKDQEDLETTIHQLFDDNSHGYLFRIKGHIRDLNNQWYEVNCTRESFSIQKKNVKRGLYVIIGQNLDEDYLKTVFLDRATAKSMMK